MDIDRIRSTTPARDIKNTHLQISATSQQPVRADSLTDHATPKLISPTHAAMRTQPSKKELVQVDPVGEVEVR